MKRLYSFFLFLSTATVVLAQKPPAGAPSGDALNAKKKNIGKINASSLLLRNLSVQYERILTLRFSVALGFRWMPNGPLPFGGQLKSLTDQYGNNEKAIALWDNIRVNGYALTPEFRFYLGKGNGQGLYLAPFLRYEQMNIRSAYPLDAEREIPFLGSYKSWGAGLMLGAQFRLSPLLTLDWWIIGPYYTMPSMAIQASTVSLSQQEREDLSQDLDGITVNILNFKIKTHVDDNQAGISSSGQLAAIRGFGFCLGIKL